MECANLDECVENWDSIAGDYKTLENANKEYLAKVEEVSDLQGQCMKQVSHQKYRLNFIAKSLKNFENDERQDIVQRLWKDINHRRQQLSDIEQSLPKPNGTYLKIILGNVNVSILNKEDKFRYKDEYEKFKLVLSIIGFFLSLLNLVTHRRGIELTFLFLLVWYYCTLTIRESILKVNGSKIKGWWRVHHFISTVASAVLLVWPNSETWFIFRPQFMIFNVLISVVQSFQFVYQQGVLYRLKALGERHNMDITIEGFHSWMWRGLSFLLPFLYLGYIFQLYNAYTLYKLCYHPHATWQGNHGTNLKKHLASHHDELYEEFLEKESKKNKKTVGVSKVTAHQQLFHFNETKYVKVNLSEKTIIDACVDLVTINGRPFSMLNDSGFRRILDPVLNGFQKKLKINSNSIKEHVYKESLLIKQEIITEASSKLISLKLDAVTRLNRSFLGVNMQYIVDDSIKLRTLGLIELTESHTGIYLKETILNILKKFKIEPKQLYTITSDNGANMLKAINLVEKDISTALNESHTGQDDAIILNETAEIHSNLSSSVNSDDECSDSETGADCSILDDEQIENILNEDIECVDSTYEHTEQILNDIQLHNLGDGSIFTGIRCVAHTLQLAVIDSLKDGGVDKLLNKVRILVRKLRNQTFIYLIKKEKLKLPILDCLTRWHSTYDMIERIQYLKEFIQIMVANDPKLKKISLNNFDWQQVEILAKTLLPAKLCTKKLQSEQLTLSDFYSTWISCKIETRALENPFSNKLVKCMEYREQFIMNNKVLLAAIFLDPRFKVTLSEIQYDMAISHLISIWVYLKDNKLNSKDNHENESMEDQMAENDKSNFNQNSDRLEQFLQERESVEVVSCSSQNSTSTVIENLLKTYHLNQKRLSYKINILQFWKSMEDTYPELYILAKIVFAVPSTQVSVERLFSGLKFILSPYRSNITSTNLENQLIVRTNRLFEKKIITKE